MGRRLGGVVAVMVGCALLLGGELLTAAPALAVEPTVTPGIVAVGDSVEITWDVPVDAQTCSASFAGGEADCSVGQGTATARFVVPEGTEPGTLTVGMSYEGDQSSGTSGDATVEVVVGVAVPGVVDSPLSKAVIQIESAGLTPSYVYDGVGDPAVIGQDPLADTVVPVDTTITLTLAVPVPVPAIVDQSRADARALLEAVGLQLGGEDGVDSDIVISQKPDPGSTLSTGDVVTAEFKPAAPVNSSVASPTVSDTPSSESSETVESSRSSVPATATDTPSSESSDTVESSRSSVPATATEPTASSAPAPMLVVPDLRGLTWADAEQAAAAGGFGITPTGDLDGRVIGQDPTPGASAPPGEPISVTLTRFLTAPAPASYSRVLRVPVIVVVLTVLVGAAAGVLTNHYLRRRPHGRRWLARHITVTARPGAAASTVGPAGVLRVGTGLHLHDDRFFQTDHTFEVIGHRDPGSLTLEGDD